MLGSILGSPFLGELPYWGMETLSHIHDMWLHVPVSGRGRYAAPTAQLLKQKVGDCCCWARRRHSPTCQTRPRSFTKSWENSISFCLTRTFVTVRLSSYRRWTFWNLSFHHFFFSSYRFSKQSLVLHLAAHQDNILWRMATLRFGGNLRVCISYLQESPESTPEAGSHLILIKGSLG